MVSRRGLVLLAPLAAALVPALCRAQSPSARTDNAVGVIDELWTAFDRSYALFEDKRVQWSRVGDVYRERAAATATESELFSLAAEMLALLNDNHVKLTGWTSIMSAGGSLRGVSGATPDFSADLVRRTYLTSPAVERAGGRLSFGRLPDSVGYVHVTNLYDLDASTAALDEALAEFRQARGLVLDLRRNLGGLHSIGRALASRFADQPRRYMISRLKRGPAPEDFTEASDWILTPPPEGGFTRPVAVLVHDRTFSAGETLLLALRVLPHVVVVGTRTSGSMGLTENEVLSNGWVYRTVMQRIVDPEGRSWEGVGIPPDLRVVNDPSEIAAERDRALELAVDLVTAADSLPPADPSLDAASLDYRLPLADSLAIWIADLPWRQALRRFRSARADTTRWYLAEDWEHGDLVTVGRDLIEQERLEEAIVVLEEAASAYRASYRPHRWLARTYEQSGRFRDAEAARRRAIDLESGLWAADRAVAVELRGRIPISRRFFDWVFDGDFSSAERAERAVEQYRSLVAREPERVVVDTLQLLRVGQQLREAGQLSAAMTVFRFVAEEFPGWPLGHLGVAEVAWTRGDREQAERSYRRVLEIDSNHHAARERLGVMAEDQ